MIRLDPASDVCHAEFDFPCDVARTIVPELTPALATLTLALEHRREHEEQQERARQRTAKACADNIQEWDALAAWCEEEIARRSNGRGQRRALIRQLAAEKKVTVVFLDQITKAYRSKRRAEFQKFCAAEVIRLHLLGYAQHEIAKTIKISAQTVFRVLKKHRDASDRDPGDGSTEP